ncbi:sugar phosphate isomerase/epimerase family protein [Christensenella tenuis]|uniref:Sugar phosphate isomerase/epimerase n=1 Tax=Christensenella tenuis TaxID=2763033 RepID=A0ABR7EBP8_9FIRM|nr:sugar phosphate isomerase/epimerase family protein [Christensenella tenuis]MBC5647161.1 sugar phosphate isomerase/epimerase [Christensenella tenuis]
MKQGVSFFSFAQNVDVREAAQQIKTAGYSGMEPVVSENGSLNPSMTDQEVLKIREIAEDFGLEIPSVGVWSLWDNNLVSDSQVIRSKAKGIVQRQLEIACLLGADTILVVPGYVGCDFAAEPEKIRYDVAYERSQEAIAGLAPLAEQLKVNIGIENVWNRFLLSPLETKRFVEEISSPYVGVYFDVGNIIYIGYPEQWIEILGSHIKKIHFCDYRADQCGIGAFVDLFAGDVDFKAVMAALETIGYDDYVTLEMLPNYKEYPYVSLYANKPAMDTIIAL